MKRIILLFLVLKTLVFADSVTDMKNKVKNIENQIRVKNTRIKNINIKTTETEKQIKEIEEDIIKIREERDIRLEEKSTISKNIQYLEQNAGVTSLELNKKHLEYKAKIIAWNKYYIEKNKKTLDSKPLLKKNFKSLLYGDLKKIDHIKEVAQNIGEVKEKISQERAKLNKVNRELYKNMRDLDSKIAQKNRLISKLTKERSDHLKSINRLAQEKKIIEQKIKEIIVTRTKVDTKVKNKSQAAGKLGKAYKPINGPIVVRFNQKKAGKVASNGIEIAGKLGIRVRAASSGKIIYSDIFPGLGKVVMIDYGYNTIGVYGNLISTKVKVNSRIERGNPIGILGLSNEGKPNLYYEVRFNLKPTDPVPMF